MGIPVTLREFLTLALEPARNNRPGQQFANQLADRRPDMFRELQEQGLDPFYKDELVWSAVEWLKQNWKDR